MPLLLASRSRANANCLLGSGELSLHFGGNWSKHVNSLDRKVHASLGSTEKQICFFCKTGMRTWWCSVHRLDRWTRFLHEQWSSADLERSLCRHHPKSGADGCRIPVRFSLAGISGKTFLKMDCFPSLGHFESGSGPINLRLIWQVCHSQLRNDQTKRQIKEGESRADNELFKCKAQRGHLNQSFFHLLTPLFWSLRS